MNRGVAFILSLSILIPMITGLIRYGYIPVSYRPLIYLLIIGFLNESICYCFFYYTSNAVPTNIYFLLEFLLYTLQFRSWRNILKHDWLYRLLLIGMVSVWVVENVVFLKIITFSPFFQVTYSFVLVLIAVNQLNWLIVNERGNILTNPIFIICINVIIFFSYKVLTEVFYYYAPQNLIKNNIFVLEAAINVGYNLILATAIICIPRKRNFTPPLA